GEGGGEARDGDADVGTGELRRHPRRRARHRVRGPGTGRDRAGGRRPHRPAGGGFHPRGRDRAGARAGQRVAAVRVRHLGQRFHLTAGGGRATVVRARLQRRRRAGAALELTGGAYPRSVRSRWKGRGVAGSGESISRARRCPSKIASDSSRGATASPTRYTAPIPAASRAAGSPASSRYSPSSEACWVTSTTPSQSADQGSP